jgi:hypothetical protein
MVRARFILKAWQLLKYCSLGVSVVFRNTTVYCILRTIKSCPIATALQRVAIA